MLLLSLLFLPNSIEVQDLRLELNTVQKTAEKSIFNLLNRYPTESNCNQFETNEGKKACKDWIETGQNAVKGAIREWISVYHANGRLCLTSIDLEDTDKVVNTFLSWGHPDFDQWKRAMRSDKNQNRKKRGVFFVIILGMMTLASLIMTVINQSEIQPLQKEIIKLESATNQIALNTHYKDKMIAESVIANKQMINLLYQCDFEKTNAASVRRKLVERTHTDSSSMYGFNPELNNLAKSIIEERYMNESTINKRIFKQKIKENCIVQNMLYFGSYSRDCSAASLDSRIVCMTPENDQRQYFLTNINGANFGQYKSTNSRDKNLIFNQNIFAFQKKEEVFKSHSYTTMGRRIITNKNVNVTFLEHDNPLEDKVKFHLNSATEMYAQFICQYTKGKYILQQSMLIIF